MGKRSKTFDTKQTVLGIRARDDSDSDPNSDPKDSADSNAQRSGFFVRETPKTENPQPQPPKAVVEPTEFETGGVKIQFPFEPYQSQRSMMSKIVEALQKKENALLESPTGSGKSLALLCGALAWLEAEKAKLRGDWKKYLKDMEGSQKTVKNEITESPYFLNPPTSPEPAQKSSTDASTSTGADSETKVKINEKNAVPSRCSGCGCSAEATSSRATNNGKVGKEGEPTTHQSVGSTTGGPTTLPIKSKELPGELEHGNGYSDFQPASSISSRSVHKKTISIEYEGDKGAQPKPDTLQSSESKESMYTAVGLPRIYVGSRTHKQITQLVKELRSNTVYRPRMAVLGSRKHYCINPELWSEPNKNEACKSLLDSNQCEYKREVEVLVGTFKYRKDGKPRIWDMEDMVKKGKDMCACSYFAARSLAEDAELVFCPYNYLIDPLIRNAMDIKIDNSIIILDEAHNIEDASREAGGMEIEDTDLLLAAEEFGLMVYFASYPDASHKLENLSRMFLTILEQKTKFSILGYENASELWSGQNLVSVLDDFGLNHHTINNYESACQEIARALKEKKEKEKESLETKSTEFAKKDKIPYIASQGVLRTMEGLIAILVRLYDPGLNCLDDYKIVMTETLVRLSDKSTRGAGFTGMDADGSDPEHNSKSRAQHSESRMDRFRKKARLHTDAPLTSRVAKKRVIKFWCLNPGVIFQPLSAKARSVILTSGTLSPMDSFASELKTSFKVRFSAGHVVESSQVWAGVLPFGPNKLKMDGTYKSVGSYYFQDELGHAIEGIIKTVPHGALCFVSSYILMSNLISRWKSTGQYERLVQIKKIILEPQKATTKVFDNTLREYYECIADHVSRGSKGGALMFAVYRGKCSEGIDFTDANCRVVIAVGVPYPSAQDMKIKLKREYNDNRSLRPWQEPPPLPTVASASRTGRSLLDIDLNSINHSTGTSSQSAQNLLAQARQQQAPRQQPWVALNGSRWYDIQAFRAYNQAVGRCIRHRTDWGAMVFLDFRLAQCGSQQNLSKWIRPLVRTHSDYDEGIQSIQKWLEPFYQGAEAEAGDTKPQQDSLEPDPK